MVRDAEHRARASKANIVMSLLPVRYMACETAATAAINATTVAHMVYCLRGCGCGYRNAKALRCTPYNVICFRALDWYAFAKTPIVQRLGPGHPLGAGVYTGQFPARTLGARAGTGRDKGWWRVSAGLAFT